MTRFMGASAARAAGSAGQTGSGRTDLPPVPRAVKGHAAMTVALLIVALLLVALVFATLRRRQ
jgi:hypothetical protein